nr:hypothetical protein [Tanacetum cinerariifolium]
MEDPDVATESSGIPSAIEKFTLDFDNENPSPPMTEGAASEVRLEEEVAATGPHLSKKRHRRVNDGADANEPPKKCGYHGSARHVHAESARSGKSTSSQSMVGSPRGIYHPGWGVTNSCRLDTPYACQDVVDHIVPMGYFFVLRHMPNIEFLSQYNKNLAQQVAMGSQLRLHFKQQEVQGLQNQTSNLKTLLEAEANMKKAMKAKNANLTKELESLHTQFLDLQVSSDQLTQQVSTLQTQVTDEERIRAAFKEFKKLKDDMVEKRHGLRLAVMKCAESIELRQAFANVVSAGIAKCMSEGLAHDIEHGKAGRGSEVMEADPWAVKEEMLLEEAITANVSRVEKKKRCRVVCRTDGVVSVNHVRSDGVPVSAPTIAPQGIAILLADAATQTETSEDDASLRLLRSKSLPPMYNLDWP